MTLSVDPEKDVSVATVRFVPTASDHGKYVTCRAVNEYFPATTKEDGYILSVKCKKENKTFFFLTSHAMTLAFRRRVMVSPDCSFRLVSSSIWGQWPEGQTAAVN